MVVVLALLAAGVYGTADFFGGLAARRSPLSAVLVASQLWSLPLLAALLVGSSPAAPLRRDLLLGAGAGAALSAGLALFYRALATGRVSVVAPVTAVGPAVVPFTWGIVFGEHPSAWGWVGVAGAVIAVVLISQPRDSTGRTRATSEPSNQVPAASGAGIAFGAMFILLDATSGDAGLWPLVVARPVALVMLAAVAVTLRHGLRLRRQDIPMVAIAGTLQSAASALYLAAVGEGFLSLIAVVVSLYPAVTVALARLLLHEDIAGRQVVGFGMAAAALALIAAT